MARVTPLLAGEFNRLRLCMLTRNGDTNVHVATHIDAAVEHCAHTPNIR
jgi:hypothetical protein